MSENIRDEKGRIKPGFSLNKAGRPKGTTGSKHKYNKSKLENMLNKCGLEAFEKIMQIGQNALEKGDIGTAIKCFVFVGGKYYELTIHNDKILMQEQKQSQTKDNDDGEETIDLPQVSFSFTPVVVNE